MLRRDAGLPPAPCLERQQLHPRTAADGRAGLWVGIPASAGAAAGEAAGEAAALVPGHGAGTATAWGFGTAGCNRGEQLLLGPWGWALSLLGVALSVPAQLCSRTSCPSNTGPGAASLAPACAMVRSHHDQPCNMLYLDQWSNEALHALAPVPVQVNSSPSGAAGAGAAAAAPAATSQGGWVSCGLVVVARSTRARVQCQ